MTAYSAHSSACCFIILHLQVVYESFKAQVAANWLSKICLLQIAKNSIQLMAWALKVEWQRKHFSLAELHISFAHPGEQFLG